MLNKAFNNELEESLKETITIENEYKTGKRKGYNNANEMLKALQELDYMEKHSKEYKNFHSVKKLMDNLNSDM